MASPPSDHAIPFTLRDHLHACLAGWPTFSSCFPASSSSRRLFNTSSSSSSLSSVDGHPPLQLARDSLLASLRHQDDDDVAAWGSDALSLRSQAGRGRTSRSANARKLRAGWVWALFAGRRTTPDAGAIIDRADVEAEDSDEEQGILGGWGGEADWDELPPPGRGGGAHPALEDEDVADADEFGLGNESDFDDDPDERGEGEGEWGAFLSAPLTSGPSAARRSRSPSPARPNPSALPSRSPPDLSIITSPPQPHPLPTHLSSVPPQDLPPLPPSLADVDLDADLGAEYLSPTHSSRPKPSSRRSHTTTTTSSARSRSTTASSSSHRSGSTTTHKTSGDGEDPDSTVQPSPSDLYGAGNPFSYGKSKEEERKERKERKRARRERREERERERERVQRDEQAVGE